MVYIIVKSAQYRLLFWQLPQSTACFNVKSWLSFLSVQLLLTEKVCSLYYNSTQNLATQSLRPL